MFHLKIYYIYPNKEFKEQFPPFRPEYCHENINLNIYIDIFVPKNHVNCELLEPVPLPVLAVGN